jgi:hypothetical protein
MLLLVIGADTPAPSRPEALSAEQVFQRALQDCEQAVASKGSSADAQRLYKRALEGFHALLQAGYASGPLHYNIANIHVRLGDLGRAILHYRRALRLAPGDGNTQRNLAFARKLCEVQIPRKATSAVLETLLFWHYGTSLAARARVATWGYLLFWLLMLVSLRTPRRVPVLSWSLIVIGLFTSAATASALWDQVVSSKQMEGVLVARDVVLRKGNGDYYDPELDRPLQPGVEFRWLETRTDVAQMPWYRIELEDGKSGWIPADKTDII